MEAGNAGVTVSNCSSVSLLGGHVQELWDRQTNCAVGWASFCHKILATLSSFASN